MEGRNGEIIKESLKIVYTNAQSLLKKMDELRVVAETKKPDIITLTETWTNDGIDNSFLMIENYCMVERKDRTDTGRGRGGGIIVYVRKDLCAWSEEVKTDFNQCTCVKVKGKKAVLCIYTVYRSPNSTGANDAMLYRWIREMRGRYVIIGDFNFAGIDWETGKCDKKGSEFYDVIEDNFLHQHVGEATQRSGNVLDLVITNDPSTVSDIELEGKLGGSDHEIITTTIDFETNRQKGDEGTRDYNRAD